MASSVIYLDGRSSGGYVNSGPGVSGSSSGSSSYGSVSAANKAAEQTVKSNAVQQALAPTYVDSNGMPAIGSTGVVGAAPGSEQLYSDLAQNFLQSYNGSFSNLLQAQLDMNEMNTARSAELAREANQFSADQARITRNWNAEQASINRKWQEEMSNSAHQREVSDLIAAGLNPILSANSGASTPAGSVASGSNAQSHMANADMTSAISAIVPLLSQELSNAQRSYELDRQFDLAELDNNYRLQQIALSGTYGLDQANIAAGPGYAAARASEENNKRTLLNDLEKQQRELKWQADQNEKQRTHDIEKTWKSNPSTPFQAAGWLAESTGNGLISLFNTIKDNLFNTKNIRQKSNN